MTLDERISLYLKKCPPAVAGNRGHDQTFTVACALVNGFALNEDDALRHLTAWNAGCCPPWSAKDLLHKVRQAGKTAHIKACGHLLGKDHGRVPETGQGAGKPSAALLAPRKDRLRTIRTLFPNPYAQEKKKDGAENSYISVGDLGASEASEKKVPVEFAPLTDDAPGRLCSDAETRLGTDVENLLVNDPPASSVETSVPEDGLVAVTGCHTPRPAEIEMADADWQKLDAAGFAGEPLVQLAAWLFGPGCTLISNEGGEVAP